jgi:hypothetical protein
MKGNCSNLKPKTCLLLPIPKGKVISSGQKAPFSFRNLSKAKDKNINVLEAVDLLTLTLQRL